jgi:hypothetical protein
MFWGSFILQTYAQHISMTESAEHPAFVAGVNLELQPGAIALASAAVSHPISFLNVLTLS